MGKKRNREQDIVERLEQELRDEKAINRALTRRLKKVDRDFRAQLEEANRELHLHEDAPKKPKGKPCESCQDGEIYKGKIVGFDYELCTKCSFKKRIKSG